MDKPLGKNVETAIVSGWDSSETRLWNSIDVSDENGCWLWTKSTDRHGYGRINIRGRTTQVHRLIWALCNGPIPKGEGYHGTCVCHSCDNPRCVRPDHLFLGSQADNMNDMRAKGHTKYGEETARSILTANDVSNILLETETSGAEMARRFGVSQMTISDIRRGKTWLHISRGVVKAK